MKIWITLFLTLPATKAMAESLPLNKAVMSLAQASKELRELADDPNASPTIQADAKDLRSNVDSLWSRAVLIPYQDSAKTLKKLGFEFVGNGRFGEMKIIFEKELREELQLDAFSLHSQKWLSLYQALEGFLKIATETSKTLYQHQLGDTVSRQAYLSATAVADDRKLLVARRFQESVKTTLDCVDHVASKLSDLSLGLTVQHDGRVEWIKPPAISGMTNEQKTYLKRELTSLSEKIGFFKFTCLNTNHTRLFYETANQL